MGAAVPGTILGNENVPEFYVRYYKPFPAPDPAAWQLVIEGLVDAPMTLTLEQVQQELEYTEQNTRMKCVECWSSRATWGGFTYASLAALVKPALDATHLRFDCADDYWEVLPVSELRREGALFVSHMNGLPLPAKYGSPLRMIFPWLYGYKGAKAVTKLTFQVGQEPGYWSTVGPYSVEGKIQAGSDYPLDIGETRPIEGGEITAY
jgi:methionine sulfoxide reductase catalytic subunit